MARTGSGIFTDPEDYGRTLPGAFDLLVPRRSEFHAHETRVSLPGLTVLRAREAAARVAYVKLPPGRPLVSFVTHRTASILVDGVGLKLGDIFLHGAGQAFHQRMLPDCRWGAVLLTPAALADLNVALAGRPIAAPGRGQIVSPDRRSALGFLRLHALTGRIAERTLQHVEHPEVARALEQDLFQALIECLASGEPAAPSESEESALIAFEAILSADMRKLPEIADVARILGIAERAFRDLCERALGMPPERYQLLKRLKLVHAVMARDAGGSVPIAETAARFGFTDVARFTLDYLDAFGELPPFP